ncbi:MAG TPA: hypothetical protein VGQ76_01760 [Thermoanaerobaculia bacterium]|jgi:hypothetical protein|nr:hypothetical protein [Thermoanaerobaculia bacterium]
MTRFGRQIALASVVTATALLLALFLTNPRLLQDPKRPTEFDGVVAWIAAHPADWLAASAITDQSLDSSLPLPQRIALWRNSYALARYLAPLRTNPTAGFVRGGLFHWYELGPDDRKAVLAAAAPMLADPVVFAAMHRPLWELTRDLTYLRRAAPRSINALWMLRELAITSGDFAGYRDLRTALAQARMDEFRAKRARATVEELLAIPPHPITGEDEPLVRAILEDIERRPFDVEHMGNRLEEIALFAIRHDVKPLAALAPLVDIQGKLSNPARARLAIALGDRAGATRVELTAGIVTNAEWMPYNLERAAFEEHHGDNAVAALYRSRALVPEKPPIDVWTNTCSGNELCTSVFRTHDGPLTFNVAVSQSDQIPPYLEVYVDDVLLAEGEVRGERTFTLNASPGPHRTEVRLVNRFTRNGTQRRARLS